jgi:NADH dehydrogenase FAD-containing subunit
MSKSHHEFVILGANFAGLLEAHYILRHIIPPLQKINPQTSYHLTIISPNTHFYFKVASPRALAGEGLVPFEKLFLPIKPEFASYPLDVYTILRGTGTAIDESTKTITVVTPDSRPQTIQYSTLVLAIGTTSTSPLWTMPGGHEQTQASIQAFQKSLPQAKTVLIAGGGPAGAETAGEIAHLYPKASVTILSGSTRLLPRLNESTSRKAQAKLEAMGVKVIHNVRVDNADYESEAKSAAIVLSDGTRKTVDVYIDSTGGKPNTKFLPASWLDEHKFVATDDTCRATKAVGGGVYAVGDVASISHGGVMDVNNLIAPCGSSILIDVSGGKLDTKQKKYQWMRDTQVVPLGPKGGVGQVFGWGLPNFLVWFVKSRNFMLWMAPKFVNGSDFKKA